MNYNNQQPQMLQQNPQRIQLAQALAGGGQDQFAGLNQGMQQMAMAKMGRDKQMQRAGMNNDFMNQGGMPVDQWQMMGRY